MHFLGITQNNFDSLWLLVVIANVSTLLPLPFLSWLPSAPDETANLYPTVEADPNASNQVGQTFLPELISEFVPQIGREAEIEAAE